VPEDDRAGAGAADGGRTVGTDLWIEVSGKGEGATVAGGAAKTGTGGE